MNAVNTPYGGYLIPTSGEPEALLVQGGRGTAGGEYLRRFWQPVAYERELEGGPLRVRIMGEDLVVFRDLSGDVGVLHLHCSHRGTSLEFGRVEEHGIRCCYHGRVFGVDGAVLEMPGERQAERMSKSMKQGAYPVHLFAGLVFAYMGPPELKPPFPRYDRFELPGIRLEPAIRMPFACNWVQVKENAMDPAHTAVLHAWEGMFASEFGKFPEITWTETPAGVAYFASRAVGDKVWVRSTDILAPNIHSISSVFEDGRMLKDCSPPWITIWTVPVDDDSCMNFVVEHLAEDDTTPASTRHKAMSVGQTPDRPYEERKKVPGDYDAMVSQGGINSHSLEHLGTLDQGVVMFRRLLKREILGVQNGADPAAIFRNGNVIPTYGTDRVVDGDEIPGDPDDNDALMSYARKCAQDYLKRPPFLNGVVARPVAMPARATVEGAGVSST